jgi:hypothetical protein
MSYRISFASCGSPAKMISICGSRAASKSQRLLKEELLDDVQ